MCCQFQVNEQKNPSPLRITAKPESKGFLTSSVAYVFYKADCSGLPTASVTCKIAYTFLSHTYYKSEMYGKRICKNTTTRKKLLMIKITFAMYNLETDWVEVSFDKQIHVSFNCQKCNVRVRLDKPSDIAYHTRPIREEPRLYAKLAIRDGWLQGYVEAMGSLINSLTLYWNIVSYSILCFSNKYPKFSKIIKCQFYQFFAYNKFFFAIYHFIYFTKLIAQIWYVFSYFYIFINNMSV